MIQRLNTLVAQAFLPVRNYLQSAQNHAQAEMPVPLIISVGTLLLGQFYIFLQDEKTNFSWCNLKNSVSL